jgi:hypothetical protein
MAAGGKRPTCIRQRGAPGPSGPPVVGMLDAIGCRPRRALGDDQERGSIAGQRAPRAGVRRVVRQRSMALSTHSLPSWCIAWPEPA